MLAARAHGLDTAPLQAWSLWPRTVREHLGMPDELILFCAVALGEADPDARANSFRAEREPLEAFAVLRGFEG